MRRRWIVVSVLAAVLSVGAITGTAFAQTEDSDSDSDDGDSSSVSRFVEVLADKLDIGEEELQSAIDETREELRAEFAAAAEAAAEAKLIARLDEMVAAGKLTQEQADEYLSWYRDRPDGVKGFGAARGRGFSGWGHHARRR